MPLDKFVLLVMVVIFAAGATVWIGSIVFAALQVGPAAWAALIPAALVGYVVWRVIADRMTSSEDDHYDTIEK